MEYLHSPYERDLDVTWNSHWDFLGFSLHLKTHNWTRRGVLSTVLSIYDPLRLASPMILSAKKIFQEACQAKLPWDEALPKELSIRWLIWITEVPNIAVFEVPRCYRTKPEEVEDIQLHIFCDGSQIAWCTVAYLRFKYKDGTNQCSLVMSKTRLNPLNGSILKTIPRLELNGARLATSILQLLRKELEYNFSSEHLWTDSMTVLKYICNERKCF